MVFPIDGYPDDFVSPGHTNGNHHQASSLPEGTPAPEGNRRKNYNGGLQASSASLVPIELEDDREPWERQPAERLTYYQWFQIYLQLDTTKTERSYREAYRQACAKAGQRISTRIFSHAAKVWTWQKRAEAFDEYCFRQSRNAYIQTVELMAARQARRGVLAASLGSSIIQELARRIKNKEADGTLTFRDLKMLLRPALDALEMGQREERLARGFGRMITPPPQEEEDLFQQAMSEISLESSPELEAAFEQLETVLIEKTTQTVKVTRQSQSSRPSSPATNLKNEERIIDVDFTER